MADKLIKGGAELQKFLTQLPVEIERKIMRSALRAGAKVIEAEAKLLVPQDQGELKDTIKVKTSLRRGQVTAKVVAGSKKVFWWRFVEFGTAAHDIKPKNAKSLFFNGIYGNLIQHPGARARPFMRPALDSKHEAAIVRVGEVIGKGLKKNGVVQTSALEVIDGD